jgi:hypothetical protein
VLCPSILIGWEVFMCYMIGWEDFLDAVPGAMIFHTYEICSVKHTGICQNMREVLRSMTWSGVLKIKTFQGFWQIPWKCFIIAHSTADKFSISFIKYEPKVNFIRKCKLKTIKHAQAIKNRLFQPIKAHVRFYLCHILWPNWLFRPIREDVRLYLCYK